MSERYGHGWTDPRVLYGMVAPEPPPPPAWLRWLSGFGYGLVTVLGLLVGCLVIGVVTSALHLPPPVAAAAGFFFGLEWMLRRL